MQKRKLILTAIFLVGLLAITAASAADNTTGIGIAQDPAEIEMMNEQPSTDENLASEDTPLLKAKEVNVTGNAFIDIQNAINRADDGGTVYLDGITYFGEGRVINVDKSINLIGKKGTVLDAQKKSSILYITHDDVVLKDIMFINGNTKFENGGAIYWDSSNAHILNCSFENNTAQDYGGANYFNKALTNSIITGNYTLNTATNEGGANYFNKALTNSIITGNYTLNTVRFSGGANYYNEELNNVTINGNYAGNTAQEGGANYFKKALTNTTITGTFINNIGDYTVFILKSDESNIIKDSIFINNTYNIAVAYGNIKVTNSWFGNNASNKNIDMTNSKRITIDNWYYLDINLTETLATVSLNNLYKTNGNTETDNNCRLPDINMTLTATNMTVPNTQTMKKESCKSQSPHKAIRSH